MSHVTRVISLYKRIKCVIKEVSTVDSLPLSSSVVLYRVTLDSYVELTYSGTFLSDYGTLQLTQPNCQTTRGTL